jgi:hypothetical protein
VLRPFTRGGGRRILGGGPHRLFHGGGSIEALGLLPGALAGLTVVVVLVAFRGGVLGPVASVSRRGGSRGGGGVGHWGGLVLLGGRGILQKEVRIRSNRAVCGGGVTAGGVEIRTLLEHRGNSAPLRKVRYVSGEGGVYCE